MTAAAAVTVVGEALVDVVLDHDAAEGSPPRAHAGGGPANIAVGLSRLGHPTTLLTSLGEDEYGALVRAHLSRNGVHVVDVGAPGTPTSTAYARLDARGAASYTFELVWDVRGLALAPGSAALHVGSLGTALAPGADAVLDLVRTTAAGGSVVVTYDPNARPTLTPDRDAAAARFAEVAELADVVKCSDEDVAFLAPGVSVEDFALQVLESGRTRLVAVTLGGEGALVATGDGVRRMPGFAVDVADTVGAGDAFMAGLIDGLMAAGAATSAGLGALVGAGLDALRPIVRQASAVAAITCSRPGADPPRRTELDALLG